MANLVDENERIVKAWYPNAVVQRWNGSHGDEPTTFTVYPDATIFRSIGDECETESEAWDSAAQRINENDEEGSNGKSS